MALFRGHGMVETLRFALVLCVASIPVAMPTVLSVTLAVGAERLARRRAVVTRLAAIEELAGIDILCSDKTGTLTQNRLSLGRPFCVPGCAVDHLIHCAALASREEDRDPIDEAVLVAAAADPPVESRRLEAFQPFDPVRKRTEATLVESGARRFRVSKGAPQVLLAMAANAVAVQADVTRAVEGFAARGYRSLAVAEAEGDQPWHLLGVLPLFDPPRDDSKTTLEELRQLGIATKLITGDQVAIAREMAGQLGLGAEILLAESLEDLSAGPFHDPGERIERADGFAQVFPEHKYRIVELLQRRGHLVGMTGDGVNDAPALKRADAGIAVSGATDAARSAADIVLLSPGLSVVVEAIRESRRIFQRMHHYAVYRIAETIRVLVFMTVSILVFDFYPLSALMIVLLALLNDGAILSIAYDRTRWSPRPVRWQMPVVLGVATALGLAGVVATFGLLWLAEVVFAQPRELIQTPPLSQALGGGTSDRVRGPYGGALLVCAAGPAAAAGGGRHPAAGHPAGRERHLHGPDRLGVGPAGVGLLAGVVPGGGSGEATGLPAVRPTADPAAQPQGDLSSTLSAAGGVPEGLMIGLSAALIGLPY
ncbi:plasma-membrane proton-efflux P-type ATPase [Synechococcus sp. CBW1107]|uniref:plasma-membrane proton-efflux P-type ATPase n=1 Tax=Synechococcus sp. CBW1107 TaxID=2789857 RepID=UPI002AD3AC08|nr:plasma-membrane proton-efflux P-type ATPase [Synechococcus sp. CBW1107]